MNFLKTQLQHFTFIKDLKYACICMNVLIFLFGCSERTLTIEHISLQELSNWRTLDKGLSQVVGEEIIIEEIDGSDGYFLISPKTYHGDLIINYKVKALSESSVMIVLFSASDKGITEGLTLPSKEAKGRDFWTWRTHLEHYNLTFNNASHGYTPFFYKNLTPLSKGFRLNKAENIMNTMEWYDVEIGKQGKRLWFKLNNELIFEQEDCVPLEGGHVLFRISGTTGEEVIFAKIAIKDLIISHE